jgi:outer membrane protein
MKRISLAVAIVTLFATGAAAAQGRGTTPTTPAPPKPATPAPPQTMAPPLPTAPAAKPAPAPVPFPTDSKVGFVNMQTIVAESKLGKMGQEEMKALHDKNVAALKTKSDAITALQQRIQSQTGVVTDAALQQMSRQLDAMQREFTVAQQNAQADEQNKNDDLLNGFQEKVLPLIDAVRTEKSLWVVFAVQTGDGGLAVASANPGLDLSMEIVKRLDALK